MQSRLSKIDTLWSLVRNANDPESPVAKSAQQQLWNLYSGAARRYLGAALRNDEAVDEVMQELGVKMASNAFRNADPDKGRFRVFMKTCLFRMVADYWRRDQRHRARIDIPDQLPDEDEIDFVQPWRDELMTLAWVKLEEYQEDTGRPWHSVLRAKIDRPELDSKQLAEFVSEKTSKPITDSNYRVMLHRAREKYADLLVKQIADSLDSPNESMLEEELAELKLLTICREALDRFVD